MEVQSEVQVEDLESGRGSSANPSSAVGDKDKLVDVLEASKISKSRTPDAKADHTTEAEVKPPSPGVGQPRPEAKQVADHLPLPASKMSAEARNLSRELFRLVDKDRSGKINESEFAAAHRIIAKVSTDFLPAAIADLDENKDGEVDRSEWDERMNTVFRSLGPETFRSVCFRSLRAVREASGDTSRLHPWIDIDFSKLGQKMTPIVGADKRGITLPQLRKLLCFIASHADEDGNLRGWWDRKNEKGLQRDTINLYAVTDWVIKPFTAKAACSFVELVVDEGTVEQTPQWFISHWWGEPVRDFIAAAEAHAEARGVKESAAYWVCACPRATAR